MNAFTLAGVKSFLYRCRISSTVSSPPPSFSFSSSPVSPSSSSDSVSVPASSSSSPSSLSRPMLSLPVCAVGSNGGQIGRATSELQSHHDLVCRLLLEKKKKKTKQKKKKKKAAKTTARLNKLITV